MKSFIQKHWHISLLLIIFILPRLLWIYDRNIVFTFDQGKDSLAVMHMWLIHTPKLIGPWTSIPGLFFGPGWYYLILPGYILFQGSPFGAVWIMVILGVVQIFLAYRYFGKTMALIIATAQAWMTTSQSAWNPFPMPLITLILLIILQDTEKKKMLGKLQACLLGFTMSLGFHFSTAFAIFYPLLIAFFFLLRKIRPSASALFLFILSAGIPFIPQIIFEFRHNFLEVHAVFNYLTTGSTQSFSAQQILTIARSVYGELRLAMYPGFEKDYFGFSYLVYLTVLTCYIYAYIKLYNQKKLSVFFIDAIAWYLIPTIGFAFLHYNTWYTLAIIPVFALIVSQLIDAAPRYYKILILFFFLCTPLERVFRYYTYNRNEFFESRQFISAKLRALEYIRAEAGDSPYASYHYVPDVYDYAYQYLYFWQAYKGLPLPVEFSYKPGESAYVTEKTELLAHFPQKKMKAEKIFFIVEAPENSQLLKEWWGQQKYQKILSRHEISPEIIVFEALPLSEK